MRRTLKIPWWSKVLIKLVLSRAPIRYQIWKRLGLFRHGDMADPTRAITAFRSHLDRARSVRPIPPGFTMLELGPGDSVLSAGVAKAAGATLSLLVDAGDFADRNTALFEALDVALPTADLPPLGLPPGLSFDEILEQLGARYLTRGIASLAEIPDASVDLIWSSVVLEHIRRDEFDTMAGEFARVLKRGGVMSHAVDLRDHLGGSLNNLRFSSARWESRWWREAGFYTNRMSQAEIVAMFVRHGFHTVDLRNQLWSAPPLSRSKIHPDFRHRTDDELCIAEFDLVMVRAND